MRVKKSKIRLLLSAVLLLIPTAIVKQAHAYSPMYFLCETKPITTSIAKWFFSDVFPADSLQRYKIEQNFTKYVANNYPSDNTGPADCILFGDQGSAEQTHSVKSSQHGLDGPVIDTGWAYAAISSTTKNAIYGWCSYIAYSQPFVSYLSPVYQMSNGMQGQQEVFEKWVRKNHPELASIPYQGATCQGGTRQEAVSTRAAFISGNAPMYKENKRADLEIAPPPSTAISEKNSPITQSYFLCETKPITTSIAKWFFSGIFVASPPQKYRIEQAFSKYVVSKYPNDNTGPADCLIYNNRDTAEQDHTVKNSQHSQDGPVVDTGWVYSPGAPPL
jgi:hypothetical protein